jgi:hypothetical protein
MNRLEFEALLSNICSELTAEANIKLFTTSANFETRVRELVQNTIDDPSIEINFDPHPQAFPDIEIGKFGIEVKFTTNDTWRSVANSVLERNRIEAVEIVYLVFGKMGGQPEVKWGEYEKSVMHVRTSHVPRFEVEIFPQPEQSLFEKMGISYDTFRVSSMESKMKHIREYARSRLKQGERLWWLDENNEVTHSLPIQARLYTRLDMAEKTKLRAEAILLCPQIVGSGRGASKDKYNDLVFYLLTYHGVLCHQARDLFSAGSVANPKNDDAGGNYIQRAILLIEDEIVAASKRLEDALFIEYWGESVEPANRIARWLEKADTYTTDWIPSATLFLGKA